MNEKLKQMPYLSELPVEKITRLRSEVLKRMDIIVFNEKMVAFARKIQKTYPDFQQYRCYHQLIGSTILESEHVVDGDFEGDDSVIRFLEGLLKGEGVDQSLIK